MRVVSPSNVGYLLYNVNEFCPETEADAICASYEQLLFASIGYSEQK